MHDLLIPWAKTTDGGYYPLLAHLIDAAVIAEVIYDEWLPERQRKVLGGLVSPYDPRTLLVASAALHDIGKANPVFQSQLFSKQRERFAPILEGFAAAGIEVASPALETISLLSACDAKTLAARHEFLSGVIVGADYDGQAGFGASVASVVAGHHGRWVPEWDEYLAEEEYLVAEYLSWLQAGGWAALHNRLLGTMKSLFAFSDTRMALPARVMPTVTGLVCLADWLASSEESVQAGLADLQVLRSGDLEQFRSTRRSFLAPYVLETLGEPIRPKGSFRDVFGFAPDRAAQPVLTSDHRPGLRVVMVPTGEGKTEAALGQWLGSDDGLFFALPTMATADAMLNRIRDMFSHSDEVVKGVLAHGHAALNSFYQPVPSLSFSGDEPQSGGLRPSDWFSGRHRALLAPVAIGTIDQLLVGMLRNKYNFLRMTGLFTKTVVLDEVHTYSPYMAELTERFLEWAGMLRINVVILSATLPTKQLHKYVNAYRVGSGLPKVETKFEYPSVVVSTGDGSLETHTIDSVTERTIALEYVHGSDSASTLAEAVRGVRSRFPDAKIGVLVNTVGVAQSTAELLPDAQLIHSRFKAADRIRLLSEVFARYGKNSNSGKDTLIATQVVEQSVDVDFDVLVTELCPAPSLVQRIGRVWRHSLAGRARSRPEGLDGPLCVVVVPEEPLRQKPARYLPYEKAQMTRTWRQLAEGARQTLRIPGDVQEFVDSAHVSMDDLLAMGDADEGYQDAAAFVMHLQAEIAIARDREIPPPARMTSYRHLTRFAAGDPLDERATRLSDLPTYRFVFESDVRTLLDKERLTKTEVRQVLNASVSASGRKFGDLAKSGTKPGWENRLLFDIVVLANSSLYDEHLGLLKPR